MDGMGFRLFGNLAIDPAMICCEATLVGRAVLSPPRCVGDNAPTVVVSQYFIAASIGKHIRCVRIDALLKTPRNMTRQR